ncbi:hypothetical protein VM1G_01076 [Cytospora mali]|uniref:HTH myb-type domain-containing protein n=1 Tax=Cytospora mali TaxID=578113 RepID=A0A194VMI4_CYTMA|nr:hypothetical protein VM1G_01076 [Valsa mali]
MAIRERWNRIIRKSVRSSTSSSGGRSDDGHTDPTTPVTPIAIAAATKSSRPTDVTRMTSWRSNNSPNNNSNNATATNNSSNNNSNSNSNSNKESSSPPSSTRPTLKHRPLSFFKSKHPRDRLPTEENLRYQDAFSMYTIQFGRSRPSSSGSCSDISPCNSRAGSLDFGHGRMSPLGPLDEECIGG